MAVGPLAGRAAGGRVLGHRRPPASADGRSASICAASEISVASLAGRPTRSTERGIPRAVKPAGSAIAGWPVWFQTGVQANVRLRPSNVRSAPLPAHRPISTAVSPVVGVTRTSNSLQLRLILWRRPPRPAPPGARRLRDARGRAGRASGARLELVGVRHPVDVLADPAQVARNEVVAGHAVLGLVAPHVVAEPAEQVLGLGEARPDLVGEHRRQDGAGGPLGDRDPQPARDVASRLCERLLGRGRAAGVAASGRDHVEEQRGVRHGPRDGSGGREVLPGRAAPSGRVRVAV